MLLPSAYEALFLQGDTKTHNRIIIEKIREIEQTSDVIVLAQGSMVTLLNELTDVRVPLLTSPGLASLVYATFCVWIKQAEYF